MLRKISECEVFLSQIIPKENHVAYIEGNNSVFVVEWVNLVNGGRFVNDLGVI